jgi:fatty acid desaturase
MYFKSEKNPLILLGITAVVLSRISFFFFDDPEGPNLLVVVVTAVAVYFLSLGPYLFMFSSRKKFVLAMLMQILIVTGFYLCFK